MSTLKYCVKSLSEAIVLGVAADDEADAGDDQQRSVPEGDGRALLRVEVGHSLTTSGGSQHVAYCNGHFVGAAA